MNFNNKNLKIALVLTSISLVVCIIIIINPRMLNIKEGLCTPLSDEGKKKIRSLKKQIGNIKNTPEEEISLLKQLNYICKPECNYAECKEIVLNND